jgi:hypothetical protein
MSSSTILNDGRPGKQSSLGRQSVFFNDRSILAWRAICIAWAVMTDEDYLMLLVWTICGLIFSCSVVAFTQHPDWFGT